MNSWKNNGKNIMERKIITLKKVVFACCLVVTTNVAADENVAAIASAHSMATDAGFEILAAGGNAFDAAIAVSATLAVVEPYSSGIGGGGFWLLHRSSDKKEVMIDGREVAPVKSDEKMYQDAKGEIIENLSVNGALAAGIPGEPAALVHLAEHYGKLPLSQSLAPAVRAATQGFKVTTYYQRMAKFRLEVLRSSPAAAAVFLYQDEVPPAGHIIKQPDLAATLVQLAENGRAGFYQGAVADKLVEGTRKAGGIWVRQDLDDYKVIERKPVTGTYHDYRIVSAAPPSSGGIAIMTMLNMLENDGLLNRPVLFQRHLLVEAMRRAYRDRAEYLGDPDFVSVPQQKLLSKSYAKSLRERINLHKATASSDLKSVAPFIDGQHTSHFSILDKDGNRVAATLSINYPFGSGFMPEGTGVLLNDEMDDFSSKPGTPNVYGLVGAVANAIAPGKRMLSSMSPTFIEGPEGMAIIGTPGGSRIITMVLHGLLGFIEGRSANEIVSQPRYHHQYLPDVIQLEPGAFSLNEMTELEKMGHKFKQLDQTYGNMQLVIQDRRSGKMSAASDPRGEGEARVKGTLQVH
ncbi:MAG: gamma-glutamyltransferase [Gammaproteobacteria bacterium]|nr:gamma-glutamyltransferase [Gammaproteobacteria bacterium]